MSTKRTDPQASLLPADLVQQPSVEVLPPEKGEHSVPAVSEPPAPVSAPAAPGTALADLRTAAMLMTPAQQHVALQQFIEARTSFRAWLLQQMVEGVHYGFPPGTEPKIKTIDGKPHFGMWKKGRDGNKGEMVWYPETQWKPKKSLYQSGADFIVELMGLRIHIQPDEVAWKMAGGRPGQIVMRCDLFSNSTGELLGNGIGARDVGHKGGDLNNSVKMASKAAKVAAVINTYALSDLFTQDLEDMPKRPDYEPPEQDDESPEVPTRGEREQRDSIASREDVLKLFNEWKTWQPRDTTWAAFASWAAEAAGGGWNPSEPKEWSSARLKACWQANNKATGVPDVE